ncbi:MAG TPA: hypothetical protein VND87_14685 [Stellaceae bacterium]|nr:hypothetical protein [Stellaceae bacterium]
MTFPRKGWPAAAVFGATLLALAGCVQPPVVTPAASPIPPGQARLWFYRPYQPSVSFNLANIDLNGARIISVPAYGPAVYRDVAPGNYVIAPEGEVESPGQAVGVSVAPAQEMFFEIDDSPIVEGDRNVYQRDVFYVKPVPPAIARAQLGLNPR